MEKLIFINNEQYFESLKPVLSKAFQPVWYSSIHEFEQTIVNKEDVRVIVICESYPDYISSIRNNLVFARYYENNNPIILLSFLPFEHLITNIEYKLSRLPKDNSHVFLQLPVSGQDILDIVDKTENMQDQPGSLPFVIDNQEYIDHIINRVRKDEVSNVPVHKILLIEDNPDDKELVNQSFHNYLAEKSYDFKFAIKWIKRGEEAEKIIRKDTDIQSVLLDWLLLEKSGAKQSLSEMLLVETIHAIRPELPIYIFTQSENPYSIISECGNKIKTYFTKKQLKADMTSVFNRIVADYNKRRRAPFWEAYKSYIEESNDSWHTPGHARGVSFRESPYLRDYYYYFGVNMFGADLSVSVEKLGSLLDSTNSIKEAQEKAAKTFGSKHVFFATNGSSTSNKVIIQTMLRPGDGVVIDRNCHKSVHYGVIQAGVGHVTYLNSEYSNKYRIFAPPSLDEIKKGIKDAKEKCEKVKALIITGCTYDGLLIDVRQIVELAHKEKLKVFIDEAWFAYAHFHPDYRFYSAVDAKADYVTHSVHKVLSALSQASIIHINDPDFNEDYFREMFYIYTSTSPQYHMIASIDVARMQMEMEGYKKITEVREMANQFRESIKNTFRKIKLVEPSDFAIEFPHIKTDNIGHDPLKVLMNMSDLDYDVEDIHKYLFEEGGLEIEKDTYTTILVLFTMGTSPDKIGRLYVALKNLDEDNVTLKKKKQINKTVPDLKDEIELLGKPADAFFSHNRVEEKIEDLLKKSDKELKSIVSTNLVTPYPPGIPLLVPNQSIKRKILECIKELKSDNVNIHGCRDGKIWVAKCSDINPKIRKVKK